MKDTAFYVPNEKVNRFAACYGPKQNGGLKVVDEPATSQYLTQPLLCSGGGGPGLHGTGLHAILPNAA